MGKKVDVSLVPANTAGVSEATLGDVITSIFDPDLAVTGIEKYLQLAGCAAAGATVMNKRHTGSFLNFGSGS